jgi:hypothetical protein
MADKIAKHLYNCCFFASRSSPFVPTRHFVVAAGREGLDAAGGGGGGGSHVRHCKYRLHWMVQFFTLRGEELQNGIAGF